MEWNRAAFQIATKFMQMEPGAVLEITGDHPRFERDIKTWCKKLDKPVIFMHKGTGSLFVCQIQF
jgi:TusA-related sulfurtransferase